MRRQLPQDPATTDAGRSTSTSTSTSTSANTDTDTNSRHHSEADADLDTDAEVRRWLQALDAADHAPEASPPAVSHRVTHLVAGLDALPGAASADPPPPVAACAGDTNALFAALYADLKRNAQAQLRKEGAGHTLSATALTHEAWFRLSEQTRTRWQSRRHFLGVAAVMMRRILVNHALGKQAAKRDALLVPLTLAEAQAVAGGPSAEVVRVHDALLAFEAVDPRAARVVELKFFGGLENEDIAQVLHLSLATVKRDWALARAWLHRALRG